MAADVTGRRGAQQKITAAPRPRPYSLLFCRVPHMLRAAASRVQGCKARLGLGMLPKAIAAH